MQVSVAVVFGSLPPLLFLRVLTTVYTFVLEMFVYNLWEDRFTSILWPSHRSFCLTCEGGSDYTSSVYMSRFLNVTTLILFFFCYESFPLQHMGQSRWGSVIFICFNESACGLGWLYFIQPIHFVKWLIKRRTMLSAQDKSPLPLWPKFKIGLLQLRLTDKFQGYQRSFLVPCFVG